MGEGFMKDKLPPTSKAEVDGKLDSSQNILEDNEFLFEGTPHRVNFQAVAASLSKYTADRIFSGFDMRNLAKIFEDESLMNSAQVFIRNGLNIAAASRALYMHRNTLMYRIKILCERTGFDLYNMDEALTFQLLYNMYLAAKARG